MSRRVFYVVPVNITRVVSGKVLSAFEGPSRHAAMTDDERSTLPELLQVSYASLANMFTQIFSMRLEQMHYIRCCWR